MTGAGIVFFAYIGFDAVSTAAQEAKNPQKDMPISIIGSLLICTVLYIIVSAIATGVMSYRDLNVPDPIAVAADHAGLGWMSSLIKLGAIAGLSSVILVMLLGSRGCSGRCRKTACSRVRGQDSPPVPDPVYHLDPHRHRRRDRVRAS